MSQVLSHILNSAVPLVKVRNEVPLHLKGTRGLFTIFVGSHLVHSLCKRGTETSNENSVGNWLCVPFIYLPTLTP